MSDAWRTAKPEQSGAQGGQGPARSGTLPVRKGGGADAHRADAQSVCFGSLLAPSFYEPWVAATSGAYNELWLQGGRGSCKSTFCSVLILRRMLDDHELSAIVYRKVAETLRESVFAQMVWAIERLGLLPCFRIKYSPLEICCPSTGQRILFRGADKPEKSKGIKLQHGYFGVLWFEELTEFEDMAAIQTIQASVLRGSDKPALTLYSYNPPVHAVEWVNKEALKPVQRRLCHKSDYRAVPPEWLGKIFLAQAEALLRTNERAYRHMYLGEVTGTGSKVFDNVRLRTVPDEEAARLAKRCHGLDFGFGVDPDAYVQIAYNEATRELYILREAYATGNSIDTLASEVRARLDTPEATVVCDNADPRLISELRQRGLQAVPARKGPGSVQHGIRWLQALGGIVIDPARCPNAAREFDGYEYQRDRLGNVLPEAPDKDNHTIDATRYAVERLAGSRIGFVERGRAHAN